MGDLKEDPEEWLRISNGRTDIGVHEFIASQVNGSVLTVSQNSQGDPILVTRNEGLAEGTALSALFNAFDGGLSLLYHWRITTYQATNEGYELWAIRRDTDGR